jgi:putative ubiquitin-RnfH superfamily antitoxin RatB of RatAB toxin-antitoxin module
MFHTLLDNVGADYFVFSRQKEFEIRLNTRESIEILDQLQVRPKAQAFQRAPF